VCGRSRFKHAECLHHGGQLQNQVVVFAWIIYLETRPRQTRLSVFRVPISLFGYPRRIRTGFGTKVRRDVGAYAKVKSVNHNLVTISISHSPRLSPQYPLLRPPASSRTAQAAPPTQKIWPPVIRRVDAVVGRVDTTADASNSGTALYMALPSPGTPRQAGRTSGSKSCGLCPSRRHAAVS
jgi:hypothetical protein